MQSSLGTTACLMMFYASLGTLLFGLKLLVDVVQFRANSVKVQGRYIGDRVDEAPFGSDALSTHMYRAQVAFQCPFTQKKRIVVAFAASNVRSPRWAGEGMSVLVNIAPPHKVRVNTFQNLYLLPLAMIAFSAPLVWSIPFIIYSH
jgi:hypothetical protein